ncbi:MAG: glycosyltransferase [Lachnospiraceae bacterium]|nr:glycosyltransferase [Lachnospiraceae bacterium]
MKPFSVCMIAKNEEKNIERCLKSIQHFDCEIIVVDTGSADRTKEIAHQYGAKVYDFEWINDFSAARNFSISKASYDWILVLDCDEWAEESTPEEFMVLAREYPAYIGRLKRKNFTPSGNQQRIYIDMVERFFNRRYYHYEAPIHEQLTPSTSQTPYAFEIPLTVLHTGYVGTEEELEAKRIRNMTLLQKELELHPDDPYLYFQMGQEYYCEDDYEMAAKYYSKVLTFDLSPTLEYLRLTIQAYGNCLIHLNRIEEALQYEQLYDTFATNPDFVFLMGRIYYVSGQPIKAMSEFIKATSMDNPYAEGTNTFLCWYYMGLINERMGNVDSAASFYSKCGDFEPALKRLSELCS